jgi:putative methionine-R-sulfoxide reductase with GAF domain
MSENKTNKQPQLSFSVSKPALAEPLQSAPAVRTRRRAISLRAKSAVNLAVLILTVIIVGAAGAAGLNNLNFQVDNLYNFMLIPIDAIESANLALSEAQESYAHIAGGQLSVQDVETEVARIQSSDGEFETALRRYDEEWVTTASEPFTQLLARNGRLSLQADELETLDRLHHEFDAYVSLREATLPRILSGVADSAELADLAKVGDRVQSEIRRLIDINLQFARVSYEDAVSSYQTSSIAMIGTGVLVTLLGAGLLVVLLRSILLPLNTLRQAATDVAAGRLDTVARVFADDEIGAVAATFNGMTAQLKEALETLEQRVADRTKALAASTEVSRRLSTILDQKQLVTEVVEQVQSAFGYYHAHIYLFDEARENLVMVGGTGQAGAAMLARGHGLPKGTGLVGRAAETHRVVLVPDTSADPGWLPNPLLLETQSEVAVPIAFGDEVLGVLDVQHNVVNGLSQEDADLLQAIADQVSIAVRNAQAYTQTQQQAYREKRINRINEKIQSAATIEDVLQITARELGQALSARRASVQVSVAQHTGNGRQ